MNPEVLLAQPRGFRADVERANGVIFIKELQDVQAGYAVVFSAHGMHLVEAIHDEEKRQVDLIIVIGSPNSSNASRAGVTADKDCNGKK
jgi:4-hydroxy-3-methylbut-2-enyl diphosphate reductase IspH